MNMTIKMWTCTNILARRFSLTLHLLKLCCLGPFYISMAWNFGINTLQCFKQAVTGQFADKPTRS